MTKTTRNAAVVVAIVRAGGAMARVDAAGTAGTHVRSSNPALAGLIRQATERSATFRGLVEVINASDGIVYVEQGDCGHGVRACLAAVAAAGSNRLLRVKVDTRKADWDLMGSIGHELQHVVEVLGDPSVTSSAAMYFFYTRKGRRGTTDAFETNAAVDAGHAVRTEVRRGAVHVR